MKINEAMNLLNLDGKADQHDIKKAYKKASIKYHPDKNPAGAEMMKAINAAYEFLKSLDRPVEYTIDETNKNDSGAYDYSEKLNEFLNKIINLEGLIIEVCGNWVWITGETKPHKDILKESGCKWAKKKVAWYFRPEEYKATRNRKNHTLDEIRERHGSQTVKANKLNKQLKAA